MARRLLLPAVALALLAACGGHERPQARPTAGETAFASEFDDLPRHPRSEPLGERTEKDGVTARSFKVTGATPEEVLEWYLGNLRGWQLREQPAAIGQGTYRGRWARGAHFLVVSASEAPTLSSEAGDDAPAQYSLSLEPR